MRREGIDATWSGPKRISTASDFFSTSEMTTNTGTAIIRSGWIVPTEEQVMRFITCYVLN